jgi:hypothetical protein
VRKFWIFIWICAGLALITWLKSGPGFAIFDFLENPGSVVPNVEFDGK